MAVGVFSQSNQTMPGITHPQADRLIQEKTGIERSPLWTAVEQAFRKQHPQCAACGQTGQLNVHHEFPFHYVVALGRYDLELDDRNLITLCEPEAKEHHLLLGHLDDWQSYNPDWRRFVKKFAAKSAPEIRTEAAFHAAAAKKPKHLENMSDGEQAALLAKLNRKFPINPVIMAKAKKARGIV